MNWLRLLTYLAASIAVMLSGCSESSDNYDQEVALRRVLTVQLLQNMNPGDSLTVPRIEAIIDSMRKSGKDAYYFGAVNFSGALADIDTLLNTRRCFPWFYLRDICTT